MVFFLLQGYFAGSAMYTASSVGDEHNANSNLETFQEIFNLASEYKGALVEKTLGGSS